MKRHILLLISLFLIACFTLSCGQEKPLETPDGAEEGLEETQLSSGSDASESTTAAEAEETASTAVDAPAETMASVAETGSEWPDNDCTKPIPKPDFATVISYVYSEADGFSANVKDVTPEEIRTYIDEVKKLGFTNSPVTEDTNYGGFDVISYEADNGEYIFKIGYTMNVATISMVKKG